MLYTIVAYIHNVNDRTIGKVTIWYKVREKKRNHESAMLFPEILLIKYANNLSLINILIQPTQDKERVLHTCQMFLWCLYLMDIFTVVSLKSP